MWFSNESYSRFLCYVIWMVIGFAAKGWMKKFNIFKRDILDCIYVGEFTHLMMGKCNMC